MSDPTDDYVRRTRESVEALGAGWDDAIRRVLQYARLGTPSDDAGEVTP